MLLVSLLCAAMVASLLTVAPDLELSAGPAAQEESVSGAVAAAATATTQTVLPGEVPAGLTATEWADIQLQIAERAEATPRVFTDVPTPLVGAVPEAVTFTATAPSVAAASASSIVGVVPAIAASLNSAGVDAAFVGNTASVTTTGSDLAAAFSTATIAGEIAGAPDIATVAGTVELTRGTVTEYFRPVDDGIEHGYVIDAPLSASDTLTIEVDVAGATPALIDPDTVLLTRPDGTTFGYETLVVFDADGVTLDSAMSVVDGAIVLTANVAGATYPVTVDPTITEDELVTTFANGSGHRTGSAVAIGPDTIAVSNPGRNVTGQDFGEVTVYNWNGSSRTSLEFWYGGINADSDYGYSIAIAGDVMVIGAPGDSANGVDAGAVYVHTRTGLPGTTWGAPTVIYECQVTDCNATQSGGGNANQRFGESVSLTDDGSVLLIGAPGYTAGTASRAYVLTDTAAAGAWNLREIIGFGGTTGFGASVAIAGDGSLAVIGDPLSDSFATDAGSAHVFADLGSGFVFQSDIFPDDHGAVADANFGAAVAIEETGTPAYAVVTEPFLARLPGDAPSGGVGGAFVYDLTDPTNIPAPTQFGVSPPIDNAYGFAVAAEGDYIVVGAPDTGTNGGIEVIQRSGGTFSTVAVTPPVDSTSTDADRGAAVAINSAGAIAIGEPGKDSTSPLEVDGGDVLVLDNITSPPFSFITVGQFNDIGGEAFGFTVAIDGDRMAVASTNDDEPNPDSGVVHIYERTSPGNPWVFQTAIFDPNPIDGGNFGNALSLEGSTLAIGKSLDTLNSANGEVYVFTESGGVWTADPGMPLQSGLVGPPDKYGTSVELMGENTLAIGSPRSSGGSIYIFRKSGGSWGFGDHVVNGAVGDGLGTSMDSYPIGGGDYVLAIGAPERLLQEGEVRIYTVTATTLDFEAIIGGFAGGWGAGDRIGASVGADSGRIVAAGLGDQTNGADFGVYVIEETVPGTWTVTQSITGALGNAVADSPNDFVDIFGGTIALARPGAGGEVMLFRDDGVEFASPPADTLIPTGTAAGDAVGFSVDIDGGTLVAGIPGDDASGTDSGAVATVEIPQIATWVGSSGGDVATATNWDIGVVPGSGDTAIIPSTFTGVVNVGVAPFAVDTLLADGGTVIVSTSLDVDTVSGSGTVRADGGAITVTGAAEGVSLEGFSGGQIDVQTSGGDVDLNAVGVSLFGGGGFNVLGGNIVSMDSFSSLGLSNDTTVFVEAGSTLNTGFNGFTADGQIQVGAGSQIRHFGSGGSVNATATHIYDIAGPSSTPANYGNVFWANAVTLGGSIDVNLLGGVPYAPTASDFYDVMTCDLGDCTGATDNTGPELEAAFSFGSIDLALPNPCDTEWTNGSGNDLWAEAGNWTSGIPTAASAVCVPDLGDPVIIAGTEIIDSFFSAAGDLDISGSLTVNNPSTIDGAVEVAGTLNGVGALTLTSANSDLSAGGSLEGSITIAAGGRIVIGGASTIDATLTVEGLLVFGGSTDYTVDGTGTIANDGGVTGNHTAPTGVTLASTVDLTTTATSVTQSLLGRLTIGDDFTVNGFVIIAAGAVLETTGAVILDSGSQTSIEISGPASGGSANHGLWDVLAGTIDLGGALVRVGGYTPTSADTLYTFLLGCNCAADNFATTSIAPATVDVGLNNVAMRGPVCDTEWTNGTTNDLWADAGNWTAGVPTASDVVCMDITATDTVLINGSQAVLRFETAEESLSIQAGATLTVNEASTINGGPFVNGTLIANGEVTAGNGGSMAAGGRIQGDFTVAPATTFFVSGGEYDGTGGGTWTIDGTVEVTGASLNLSNGGDITNNGTLRFNSAGAQNLAAAAGGSTITNTGTISKSGTGTVTFAAANGLVVDMEPGSVLELTDGLVAWDAVGTWNGDGTAVTVTSGGGDLNLTGDQTFVGDIAGTAIGASNPGRVTISGTITWGTPDAGNTLDFAEATPSTGPSGYMLGTDAATFTGDPFEVIGFLNVAGSASTTFNSDVAVAPTGTIATTGSSGFEGGINGTGNVVNQGNFIAGAEQLGTGSQTFTNEGTFRAVRTSSFLSVNYTWVSTPTSIIEAAAGSITDMQSGHTELGTVRISPSARLALSVTNTFGSSAVYEFEINGPSTSFANYGRIESPNSVPTIDPGATLRVTGTHTPVATDSFFILQCDTGACPTFSTTDIAGYQQTLVGNNLHLTANPCDVEWTNGSGDDLWSTAANWSTNAVPGPSDNVCMDIGATDAVTVDGTQVIGSFETATETLSIAGSLTVNNASTIDAAVFVDGTLNGVGEITLATSGFLDGGTILGNVTVDTGVTMQMPSGTVSGASGGTLTNNGTLNITGDILVSDSADIVNNATMTFGSNTPQVLLIGGAASTITNNGEIFKAGLGALTIPFGVTLDMTSGSTLYANTSTGAVSVFASGTWTGTPSPVTVRSETGASITVAGDQTMSGEITGLHSGAFPGQVTFSGTKTAGAATDLTLPDGMLFIDGATFAGTSPFTVESIVNVINGMTVTADMTVAGPAGELFLDSGSITINGTLTNDNFINGAGTSIDFDGSGTIDNNGVINTTENGLFDIVGPTLLSDPGSTLNLLPDTSFTIDTTYTELGRLRIQEGALAGLYGPFTTLDTGSTVELIVAGNSTLFENYGRIDIDNGAALTLNGTLETTEVGYTPTSADSYTAISCNVGTCPTFPTAVIGQLVQAAVGTNLLLQGPACDTEWTNGSGDNQWTNPANWTAGVPTATDAVCMDIARAGTVVVTGAQEILRFETAAEPLNVDGTLIVNEASTFDSGVFVNGTLIGLGGLTAASGGAINAGGVIQGDFTVATGVSFNFLDAEYDGTGGGTFTNDGTVSVGGGTFELSNGGDLVNNGTFSLNPGLTAQAISAADPGSVITNNGVIEKGSTQGTNIDAAQSLQFDMTEGSSIEVTGGTLDILAGGTWTAGTGIDLRVDAGATLLWQGGQNVSGIFRGTFATASPGKVRMTGVKTSSTSTTLDFPESLLSPGFANAYQLEWNDVTLLGNAWIVDGFVRTWLNGPGGSPQAFISSTTLTLNGEVAQQSPEVRIDGTTFTNNGLYRAIGSANDVLSGTGTFVNNGTFRRQPPSGTSVFAINVGTWTSSTSSVIEVIESSTGTAGLQINDVYVESGLVSLEPNTQFVVGGASVFDSDSVVDIEIDGDSSTTENYGQLVFGLVTLDGELRTSGGYVPVAGDAYTVATCSGTCPTWPTTDIGALTQTIQADDVVLELIDVPGKLSGTEAGSDFGFSVDTDGDLLVIGAPLDNEDDGAAFVFRHDGSDWILETTIDGASGSGENFGTAVAVDDQTVYVGAPGSSESGTAAGAVFVYQDSGGGWAETDSVVQAVGDNQAGDQFGGALDVTNAVMFVGAPGDDAAAADAGAVYRFNAGGSTAAWGSVADKVTASDAAANDSFGSAVALRGPTAVVGAPNAGGTGQAYILELAGNSWIESAILVGSDSVSGDGFGTDVAVAGATVLVGAPDHTVGAAPVGVGAVYVFSGGGATWPERDKLTVGASASAGGRFGAAVDVIGDLAVIGATGENASAGAAYIYERTFETNDWTLQGAELTALDASTGDNFGGAVAISADHYVIGASQDVANGSAYTGTPVHPAVTDRVLDPSLDDFDQFGFSIDIDGTTAVVGAPNVNSGLPFGGGTAFVFTYDGSDWVLEQELIDPDPSGGSEAYGYDVTVDGDTVAIGSWSDEVWIWTRSGTTWTSQVKIDGGEVGDGFGTSVDLDGTSLAIGAALDDTAGLNAGAAFVYTGSGATWTLQQELFGTAVDAGDRFGVSVALSGDLVTAGAPGEDQVNPNLGAVYVFQRSGATWTQTDLIDGPSGVTGDSFGESVALDGTVLAVGAPNQNFGGSSARGFVHAFEIDGAGTATLTGSETFPTAPAGNARLGTSVDVSGTRIVAGAVNGTPDDGTAYVFAVVGSGLTLLDTFAAADNVGTDALFGDRFGQAVGIDGDLVLVGASQDDTQFGGWTGSAHAFTASPAPQPVPANKAESDAGLGRIEYGFSVSIGDGDLSFVAQNDGGGAGQVLKLTQRNVATGAWATVSNITPGATRVSASETHVASATDSGFRVNAWNSTTGFNNVPELIGAAVDASIDLQGDLLIVGEPSVGQVRIYEWDGGTTWTLVFTTTGTVGTFGHDVAIDGDAAFVTDASAAIPGSVVVFERVAGTWQATPAETLTNPDGDVIGDSFFGSSVDIEGTTLVVGHSFNNDPNPDQGSVWVYEGTPGTFGSATPVQLLPDLVLDADTFGAELEIDDDFIIVGAPGHNVSGDPFRSGGAWVFNRSGSSWVEVDYLTASDREADQQFGAAVTVHDAGGVARSIVGAPLDDNNNGVDAGAIYWYESAAAPLPPPANQIGSPSPESFEDFGFNVDHEGDILIVGAPGNDDQGASAGTAYAFVRQPNGLWQFDSELAAPPVAGLTGGEDYGTAVTIARDGATDRYVAAVSAPQQGDGVVYFWQLEAATWSLIGSVTGDAGELAFGNALDITNVSTRDFVIAIGTPDDGFLVDEGPGAVYVYNVDTTAPSINFLSKVLGTDTSIGTTAPLGTPHAGFGSAVAIDGDTLLVGAPFNDGPGSDGGEVAVLRGNAGLTAWTEEAVLSTCGVDDTLGCSPAEFDFFGFGLDLDGDTAAVGATGAATGGRVFVFDRVGTTWSATQEFEGPASADTHSFGISIDLENDVLLIGASGGGDDSQGEAHIYRNVGGTWTYESSLTGANAISGDQVGIAVSLTEEGSVILGSRNVDVGGVVDAGATYAFQIIVGDDPTLTFTLGLSPGQLPPVVAGGTGIPISALGDAATLIEDNADNATSVGSTSLQDIGVAESALAEITLGATPFGAIATGTPELANLPILSIGLDLPGVDGWSELLDLDPNLADVPLVNLTVEDVFGSPNAALQGELSAIPFGAIDVNGTPFGAIPFGAIALEDTPLTLIPPSGDTAPGDIEAEWCAILAGTSFDCGGGALDPNATLMSVALSDVPFGAIPFGAIPFGAIPFGAIELGGINLSEVALDATPFGAIPFGAIDITGTPFGAIPFGAIPFGAIPFGAIDANQTVDTIPFGAIPFGAIPLDQVDFGATDVNGTPFGAIPFGAIALGGVSLDQIPLDADRTSPAEIEADWCSLMAEFNLDCENPATAITNTTVTDLGVRGVPFGAIPFGAIPFGAIPFGAIDFSGTPFGAIPFGAIPFGAINLNAVDILNIDLEGTPFGAIPFGAIPFGAIDTSVGAIPFGAIDIQGSPFGAIELDAIDTAATPFGAIPFGAISVSELPFGAIPFGAIDFASTPFGAIPFGAINVGDIPFGAIDLVDSPFGAIPFGAIPFGAINGIVDCNLIDCESDATLRDAFLAGALLGGATISQLGEALDDFRLPDLAEHFTDGTTAQELYDAVFAFADANNLTLAELTGFANMTLADLPATNPLVQQTVLNDIKAGLNTVTFEDLALALLASGVADPQAELENVVYDFGSTLTLADFDTYGDTTFSELLPAFSGGLMGDLGAFLAFIHLGELDIFTPGALADALANSSNGGPWLVSDAVNDPNLGLGDMKLVDIIGAPQWGGATVNELVDSLPPEEVENFTFADLLLGLLPPGALPWGLAFENVDAADIPGVMPPVTLRAEFSLTGGRDRAVEISVELPTNAAYLSGSSTINPALDADIEPEVIDGRLVWNLTGIEPGPDSSTAGTLYELDFDVQPTLNIGASSVAGDGRIVGANGTVGATASISVLEAFEDNDVPGDAIPVAEDTIYLVHIPDSTDVDMFEIVVGENDQLAVDLSGLPADYDVVLYSDLGVTVESTALSNAAGADPIVPVLDPDADTSETLPDQSFPRADLDDPNLAIVEISNSRGTDDETIVTDRLPAGRYIIQIHGHDGASSPQPAVLQVQIVEAEDVPVCTARGSFANTPAPGAAVDFGNLPADLNTVFLINEQRYEQVYGTAGRTQVVTALNDLITAFGSDPEISQLGLSGIVVPVDSVASVRDAFAFWDDPVANGAATSEPACDPDTANAIVSEIIGELINPIRAVRDIENIVVIGSDDLLPFARLTDGTQVANEFDYRHDLSGRNAFTGSFWESTILSDDPYAETAALPFGDRFIYLPDAALGRLLEDPQQVTDQIDQFIAFDGFLEADTGLVAGYDFLIDGSEAISDELGAAIPPSGLDDELADGTTAAGALWSATDAFNALIGDVPAGDNGPDIVSFNAHFDHYRALPAAGDGVAGFADNFEVDSITGIDPASELFNGSLVFSMGCHSGLNVPDTSVGITGVTDDWAEAFTDQQAVYVANTGFGYGDTETVGYTERLLQLFARNLATPVATDILDPSTSTTIGQALQFAKQEAFAELPDVSVYHEKALQESTLYGLPFYRLGVAPTQTPPAPDNEPTIDPLTGDPANVFVGDAENIANVTIDGETYFANVNEAGDPTTVTQPGRPIQPTLVIDVTDVDPADSSQLEREARGAIIVDMMSTYVSIDPVVSVPVFDESSQAPEPDIDGIVYPTVPQNVTTLERPEGTRQQLVLATGQYRGTEDAGVQRLDDDIDVVVYYSNDADVSPPSILQVDSQLNGAQLTITADVDPGSGTAVDRVYVLVAPLAPGAVVADWVGIDLVQSLTNANRWSGGITFDAAPADIEFLVQAKDGAGNVGVSTNKAVNFSDDDVPPPVAVNLTTTITPDNPTDPVAGFYTGDVIVDADADDLPITYTLDGGPVTDLTTAGVVVSGDGVHIVEFRAADGQSAIVTLNIDTLAPTVTISQPLGGQVFELNEPAVALFSCQDPAGATCSGDVGGVSLASGDPLPTNQAGTFVLEVRAVDALGNSITEQVSYSVQAPPAAEPEILLVDAPVTPQNINDGVIVDVEFDDADGVNDTYTVTIDYGDLDENETPGSSTTCVVSSGAPPVTGNPTCELVASPSNTGTGLVASSFDYDEPGVYTITVTVEDGSGNIDTSVFEFVVVYDPAGGRVSGAGWFWSGDEAFDDRDRWGEWAFFGYNARYRNNEDTPRGRTRLHLLGEFYFRSTGYDYLIINDTLAVAEGVGRVDGQSGYRFRVQGVDNGWIDFFQITIWDDDTGEVLYDNGVLFDKGDLVLFGGIRIRS